MIQNFSDFYIKSPGPPCHCFPPNPSHGKWHSTCYVTASHQTSIMGSKMSRRALGYQNVQVSQGWAEGTLHANRKGHGCYYNDPPPLGFSTVSYLLIL